ncbi:MAG: primosomal protein N' [Myxococcales bacterium]|nr:primosomal protein N' [Myxococcales bacterium]
MSGRATQTSLFDLEAAAVEATVSGPVAEIAVPVPVRRTFHYRVPEGLVGRLQRGSRVAVPFGGRKSIGFVLAVHERAPAHAARLRELFAVLDDEPIFPEELLGFLEHAAAHYLHPIGDVLRTAAPALETRAIRALRASGVLEADESLRGRAVAARVETWVVRTGLAPQGRLGPAQQAVLEALRDGTPRPLRDLARAGRDVRAAVQALVRRGLLRVERREAAADPYFATPVEPDTAPVPSDAQARAIEAIAQAVRARRADRFLLFGVTGSGKTEVYMRVIAEVLREGRGALVLVPEIALTPQLVARFRARLGDSIAVLHSGLGDRARHDAWRALRTGRVRLAIGARSALFAPVADLALLVVDEEHDPSYKQEEGFRYHARDMALLRARRCGAVAVLGSATPSVESFALARAGELRLLELPRRAAGRPQPRGVGGDLRSHRCGPSGHPLLSGPLHRAIEDALGAGEQVVLFLNRRGFSPSLRCAECGRSLECPACSVALTEHDRGRTLRCHYCDHVRPVPERCPGCGGVSLERIGLGTERLEEDVARIFAPARVARLDRDVASGAAAEVVLERMRRGEIDVLVGTQMVTKGHDLPGVTVVGALLADQSLAFPDFRSQERTFALLAQVAGRAGRGARPGRVFVQTWQPDEPAIACAAAHDYVGFCRGELERRRQLGYPPFGRLVAIRLDGGDEQATLVAARELVATARACVEVSEGRVAVLGPATPPIARIRGRWRQRILLRSADDASLRRVALAVLERIEKGLAPVHVSLDVDPVNML